MNPGRLILPAAILIGPTAGAGDFPSWAYPVDPPGESPPADNGMALRVPGSLVNYSRSQTLEFHGPVPDWHPDEHPPMPPVVGHGHGQMGYACGYCHLPSGAGRPENASLAGLSAAYIKQQVLKFRSGERPGSGPERGPQVNMIALAKAATDRELDEAAAYFARLKPESFVHVVETTTVPKTRVAGWVLTRTPGGGTEPIAGRIVEMPVDFGRFENRDSRILYVAYVPVGSIKLGAALAATGASGRSVACAFCHGPELQGVNDIPRLAGRSPSYMFRQMYDLRAGMRKGGLSEVMKPVVAHLSDGEMVALAAYLASRPP